MTAVSAVASAPAVLECWLEEVTEVMLDAAGVTAGSRVLDVAAGAGGQAAAAAERTGSDGIVLATDVAEPQAFDAAICRLGPMFLPDLGAALARIRWALRPGGRLAVVVYGGPDRNQFLSIPIAVIRRHAGLVGWHASQLDPFALGGPGVLVAALRASGFEDVSAEVLDAPLQLSSVAECMRFERESFAFLHQLMAGLDAVGRADAWAEIEDELRAFDGPAGFAAPCELIVAAGTRPLKS